LSVWLAIPSKRPPEEAEKCLKEWRERGYKIAVYIDGESPVPNCDYSVWDFKYPGYAIAVNRLCGHILDVDPQAEWIVAAGDDTLPDPNHSAEEIAEECRYHFEDFNGGNARDETFGVMQPTGDRDFGDAQGPYIDRVAGSPWIGREFARRMYGGNGPYWPDYTHMGVDEEIQAVAIKYGVFWQRPDLIHYHDHWGRPRKGEKMGMADRMPDFLAKANSPEEWKRYKAIYAARKAAGFPGSEPIP